MTDFDHVLDTALFVTPLTHATLVYAIVGIVLSLLLWWPLVRFAHWSAVPTLLALLTLTAALALTLAPDGATPRDGIRACVLGAPSLLQAQLFNVTTSPEALLNTVLLVPFGIFAVLAVRRVMPVALFVILLPAAIELGQTRIGGRLCSGIDYVTNVVGALVGVAIGGLILAGVNHRRRRVATLKNESQDAVEAV